VNCKAGRQQSKGRKAPKTGVSSSIILICDTSFHFFSNMETKSRDHKIVEKISNQQIKPLLMNF